MDVKIGDITKVEFPFYIGTHVKYDIDGHYEEEVWIPGCKIEPVHPDDSEFVASAVGEMILEVISIHKPGRYPERVFYTRKWIDPEGKEFGSGKLFITTTPVFKRRRNGYYHEYRIE